MSTVTIPSPRTSVHSKNASVRSKPPSAHSIDKPNSLHSKPDSVHLGSIGVPSKPNSVHSQLSSVRASSLSGHSEHIASLGPIAPASEHITPPFEHASIHPEHISTHLERVSVRSVHVDVRSETPIIPSKPVSHAGSIALNADCDRESLEEITGFFGEIITPTNPSYSDAIARWAYNAERPARLVVYPRFTTDIFVAISHAYKHSLPIAVRGGGHSCAGTSSSTQGVVIDLSRHFTQVRIDPTNRIAFVGGGAVWRDVDEAAIRYGLAAVGGTVNHTGVGGLTLGGGYGWLTGQYGLACDNVVAATIIIPGAAVYPGLIQPTSVTVSAFSDPDLFFAIRGGGGNFGVVTEFAIKLHPQRRTVWSGTIIYEASVLEELFEALDFLVGRDRTRSGGLRPFFNGSKAEGRERFASFISIQHLADQTKELPYELINAQQNEQARHGDNVYMTGTSRSSFPPVAARALFTAFSEISAPPFNGSAIIIEYLPLHLVRAASSETSAFPGRLKGDNIVFLVHWPREATTGDIDTARAHANTLKEVIWKRERETGGEVDSSGYANYQTEAADHDAAANHFGSLYPRLQVVKAQCDPQGLFDKFYPIRPAV
ncbi:hypothetical protein OPQ81_002357 [Rhizoctonia solani]|nr:hypothetical protein OPQ81_002357 [Rhizoctonia solani]